MNPKEFRKNEARLKGNENAPSAFDDSRISFHQDIEPMLNELRDRFRAYQYSLLAKNCNHFAAANTRIQSFCHYENKFTKLVSFGINQ